MVHTDFNKEASICFRFFFLTCFSCFGVFGTATVSVFTFRSGASSRSPRSMVCVIGLFSMVGFLLCVILRIRIGTGAATAFTAAAHIIGIGNIVVAIVGFRRATRGGGATRGVRVARATSSAGGANLSVRVGGWCIVIGLRVWVGVG